MKHGLPAKKLPFGRRSFLQGSALATAWAVSGLPINILGRKEQPSWSQDHEKNDVIVVGSGINSLVAAAILAKNGQRVCVLERNDAFGGCIRTEDLTLPGFYHDTLSSFYPLFLVSPAYAELKAELSKHGLQFASTKTPTAVVFPDNHTVVLSTTREENIQRLERLSPGDGQAYDQALKDVQRHAQLTFGLLGKDLWSYDFFRLLLSTWWDMGLHGLSSYFGKSLQSCRAWLSQSFGSKASQGLLAPWQLHVGLGPEDTLSANMTKVIFFTLEQVSLPVVIGGSKKNDIHGHGVWTEEIKELYAQRIINRLSLHITNLTTSIIGKKVLSPKDLEGMNVNLVGGDPYTGVCSLDQFFYWRPLRGTKNHKTPIANLYHIGASTHPGPGLGGGSGYLAAQRILS